jgi:excisionase family DNA binding protein
MPHGKSSTPRLLGLAEAAEQLSLSRRTIERLVTQETIRAVRVGRRRLIEAEELARFVERAKT